MRTRTAMIETSEERLNRYKEVYLEQFKKPKVEPTEVVHHQPREHAVKCRECNRRATWNYDAVCDGCRED